MTENNEISQKIKKPRVKTAPLAKYYNDNLFSFKLDNGISVLRFFENLDNST